MTNKTIVALTFSVLLFAAYVRLRGVNWDQGQHLHPDERFLTMVTENIVWPRSLQEYLDTDKSPLNPHNRGFGFFVYGTFPIFATKWIVDVLGKSDYGNITLVGRQLSALMDLGTVALVYVIAKQLLPPPATRYPLSAIAPLLSALFYASMVLPIQLSHFYAVDTYMTFFITLSFFLLTRLLLTPYSLLLTPATLGVSFGFALASKITAVLFLPIIGLGFLCRLLTHKDKMSVLVSSFLFSVFCFLAFRLAQPYLFAGPGILDVSLNSKVVDNWRQLKSFDDPSGGFPPAVQWVTTKSYLFPLKNMVFWGLGLPLGVLSIASVALTLVVLTRRTLSFIRRTPHQSYHTDVVLALMTLWVLTLFVYQGAQFVKALRYFFPLYPFLAILSGWSIASLFQLLKHRGFSQQMLRLGVVLIAAMVLAYPLSFVSIYTRPHTRIAASEWIYQHVPAGSFKSDEHWDDGLPLSLPTDGRIHERYTGVEFPLYFADTPEKWTLMVERLRQVDYIFLTSNRLYGSLTTLPQRYPVTFRYYTALFDGSLGFEKVAEFTSRPNLPIPFVRWCLTPPLARYGIIARAGQECPLPGISLVDDYADETFTVYDHPKVIIFKKVEAAVDYAGVLDIQSMVVPASSPET